MQKGSESDADADADADAGDEDGALAEPTGDAGESNPMKSIWDLANADREETGINELEFAQSSGGSDKESAETGDAQASGGDPTAASQAQADAEGEPEPGEPIAEPSETLSLDEVVVAGSDASSMIKLTRLADPLEARSETTPIAPLDSLPPDSDVTKPILPLPTNDAAALEPIQEPSSVPVNVSPLSPPPGLRPAVDAPSAAAAAKAKADQAMLNLEPTSKGRFAKSEPTIVDGQDLDVPTLLRTTKKS